MLIRWLQQFRGRGEYNLPSSLNWELSQRNRQVAAENCNLPENGRNKARQDGIVGITSIFGQVGLVFKTKAVVQKYSGDVWSEIAENGKLYATRGPVKTHSEVFCHAGGYGNIAAIVCRTNVDYKTKCAVRSAAKKYNVGLIWISVSRDGKIRKVGEFVD